MLQEGVKAIKTVLGESFIKRLSQYLHDCVREEVKSSTFRNLKGDKDNKWIFIEGDEKAFAQFDKPLALDGADSYLTEIMIQSDMDTKDKYLIYGYLFLAGKNSKAKKNNEFLTPVLYAPCKLERHGTNILLNIQEDLLSLNTGALAQLMQKDDEEEADAMLSGLLDVVPDLPLTQEGLDIFITTLKSLVPDIEITDVIDTDNKNDTSYADDFYSEDTDFDALVELAKKPKVKVDKICLCQKQAVILTKRPNVTAGVLHELTQIADKPAGIIRENALNCINQEYLLSNNVINSKSIQNAAAQNKNFKDFFPITPLSLSDSQKDVIRKIEQNDFLAVYGPPGTGKSQTIVNLAAHLIAQGKTVLVASRMDKAIDVVSQRLEELQAPYLALRAGRANYQKQLNYKLQDLLSNKVDLESEYIDAVLVDAADMKTLLDEIKTLENKVEKIIKLEEKYTEVQKEREETLNITGKFNYIKKRLTTSEVLELRKILKNLEKIKNKNGLLVNIKKSLDEHKLKKTLDFKDKITCEILLRISYELDAEEVSARLLEVEEDIYKTGNLHQILNKIAVLKGKQKQLAIDILKCKRREALKDLLSDQKKRQRLIVHSKSLISKKLNQQTKILEKEDFKPLLGAFPCWCVTTYAISNSLPLKSGLFDVVIIDEASQCDIASCFPILYRAKKAIIVGDDNQLPHLSFLEKAKEQSFLNQYNIEDKYQLMWRFRTNSMFDLANYYSTDPVLLDEHFRSKKPIIEFSSREFYGGRIKIMKPFFNDEKTVQLVVVKDAKVDLDATRNMAEAECLIQKLRDIVACEKYKKATIGIISPFRAQVELLKADVIRSFSQETILQHEIEVGTAHTFQGDERDIMLISWTIAPNSRFQSLMFLQKHNLFNVAITRARLQNINFVSRELYDISPGLLRDYLEYVKKCDEAINPAGESINKFKNDFEREVFYALQKEGFSPYAGVECGGVSMDILVNKTVIECDGVVDEIKSRVTNMQKQAIIERCGYKVIRLTKREWGLSQGAAIERVGSCII